MIKKMRMPSPFSLISCCSHRDFGDLALFLDEDDDEEDEDEDRDENDDGDDPPLLTWSCHRAAATEATLLHAIGGCSHITKPIFAGF